MTLVKWTPKTKSIFNDMDTMFNSIFNNDMDFSGSNVKQWTPYVDMEEKDKEYIITADIPGLTKKDVKVNISNGMLKVTGERNIRNDKDDNYYHYRERQNGLFSRTFNIPESVKEEEISGSFKNGILTIKLPKHEEALHNEREVKIS